MSVLISSFFVEYYGLNFTDPLCSILISLLILYSSYPVLKSSFLTLLHCLNKENTQNLVSIKKQVKEISNKISISRINYYYLNSDHSICELEIVLHKDNTDKELKHSDFKKIIKNKIVGVLEYYEVSEYYIDIKFL